MAPHRARVMQLLAEARGSTGTSLCLLGAGNANDVELAKLSRQFEHIALVDLDEEALANSIASATIENSCKIERHASIDLTGILSELEAWRVSGPPSHEMLVTTIQLAKSTPAPDVGSFDVVASTCVLTQLIDSVCMGLPAKHPQFLELLLAVRNRHLEVIVELLNPGGAGVLISDFVSTQTAPELANWDESEFAQNAIQLVGKGNFFTGANPFSIRDFYRASTKSAPTPRDVHVIPPWLWDIGAKQFAVSAVTFRV